MSSMTDTDWPFDQPRHCAVVTLRSIIFDGEPILQVFHDADDHGWQFLDGKPIHMANAALVRLSTIVQHDPSVLHLADMPSGWCATRTDLSSPWRCKPAERD
jgi:hypothetical protein